MYFFFPHHSQKGGPAGQPLSRGGEGEFSKS